jgi:glycosyltransferase involved in cell wall biosynthesis
MNTSAPLPDVSIIIGTRNRAESLRLTLESLATASREGLRTEVIVVDNAGTDNTAQVVEPFAAWMPLRYLYEPVVGTFGKSHALNRAIDDGGLGEIVAVLDDDISVDPEWFHGVMAICKRWPDKDVFSGETYVIWPAKDVPAWAERGAVQGSIFSAAEASGLDNPFPDGGWFLGGHFWFRSRVLKDGRRFKDVWLTEPDFQLDLIESGLSAAAGPDAVVGHRVQALLLRTDIALSRARRAGEKAWVRLRPYRNVVRQARLFHSHPFQARIFCLLNHLRWRFLYCASYLYPSSGSRRFERRLIALERMSIAFEYLRAAAGREEHSIWKRRHGEQIS